MLRVSAGAWGRGALREAVARAAVGVLGVVLAGLFAAVLGAGALGCGSSAKKPGCESNADCKSPLMCAAGKCVECTDNTQCADGKRCTSNACVAAAECVSDENCAPGMVCQAGRCKACASDGECGPGGSCQAGSCTRGKKCSKDEDCADDEHCEAGTCKKEGATGPVTASCTLSTVYFAFDDSAIQASERDRLAADVACVEQTKGRGILLIGHTDSSGTEEYNIALSERRAQSVADYMARLGTDPARMQVVPKGKTEPTGQGDDKDRRVEFQWH